MSYTLYQRKTKGKKWYVRFTARGKQFRVTTGETDKNEAELVAGAIYLRALSGTLRRDNTVPMYEIIENYMGELRRRDCVMPTMNVHATFWKAALNDRPLYSLMTHEIVAAMDEPSANWKPATYNRYLAFIKAAINHAIKFEIYNKPNPAAKISKKKEVPRDTFLKPAQVEHVLRKFNEADWPYDTLKRHIIVAFLLTINTGIRAGELLTLQWFDIDNVAGTITLQAKNTKSLKKRTIPVDGYLLAELASIRPSGVDQTSRVFTMTYNNLRTTASWISQITGMDVKWHDLRHTFAVAARRNGMDMMTLMKVLGHADIASTQRYAEFGDDTEYTKRFMPNFEGEEC